MYMKEPLLKLWFGVRLAAGGVMVNVGLADVGAFMGAVRAGFGQFAVCKCILVDQLLSPHCPLTHATSSSQGLASDWNKHCGLVTSTSLWLA